MKTTFVLHAFFIRNAFFQLSLSVLYLLYLFRLLMSHLGLFMSFLCDLFFVFSLIFIVINHITSFKQTSLFFVYFLKYLQLFWIITWMKNANNFQIVKVQPQGVAQLLLDFLSISVWRCLQKCCLLKKRVIDYSSHTKKKDSFREIMLTVIYFATLIIPIS